MRGVPRGHPAAAAAAAKQRKPVASKPTAAAQHAQELQRLAQENASLSAHAAEATARADEATERLEEARAELLATGEREQQLATLLSTAGYDALSLGPLSWSAPQAQALLEEEEEAMAELAALEEKVRGGRARVQKALYSQELLKERLRATLVPAE